MARVAQLAARLPPRPRTRFAPAPTGYLHLGHVLNAAFVWGLARLLNGSVVLRIEDHDATRSARAYEASLIEDLAWLGFVPDEGAVREPDARPIRQSERAAVYDTALARLDAEHLVYACTCSRRDIEQQSAGSGERRYQGTCRHAGHPRRPGCGLRVRIPEGEQVFDDGLVGPQVQNAARDCGDVLIRDRHGHWTYQFAVTVDDIDQRIDLVVRGADLLSSTGRQIALAALLGRATPPAFVHHPLLYAASGVKLSKSNQDTGVRELRAEGHSPAVVLGLALERAGLLPQARAVQLPDLPATIARAFDPP